MSLPQQLWQQLTPYKQAKRWLVGFSGGMDSTVLLHLLAELKQQHKLPELIAIYIHHGLQTIAEAWPQHCQQICDKLDIPLTIIKVTVAKQASIEQAAREARYQAFSQLLQSEDILLTAQHQNDQAETMLFRLVRGAGVRGLLGIPVSRPLGAGTLIRPLLNIPYQTLRDYAEANKLTWIDDPSNQDTKYARNYLRQQVIPQLQHYWPQAVNNITQAANHFSEAQSLLNELAYQDLQPALPPPLYPWLNIPSLLLAPIANLSWIRQKNAIAYWLAQYTHLLPTTVHWQGWHNLLHAKPTATPIWRLHHAELQRSHDRAWLLTGRWLEKLSPIKQTITINEQHPLTNNGYVIITGEVPTDNPLFISYRQGGEIIQLAKRGHRDLKRLFNEQALPHFIRQRIPLLINAQGKLIAVANFPQWRDQHYQQHFNFEWRLSNDQD